MSDIKVDDIVRLIELPKVPKTYSRHYVLGRLYRVVKVIPYRYSDDGSDGVRVIPLVNPTHEPAGDIRINRIEKL